MNDPTNSTPTRSEGDAGIGGVFSAEDVGDVLTLDLTGAVPVDLGDGNAWAVTLCYRVAHDPALALWGVAHWESLQSPVGCFIAPITADINVLTGWAARVAAGLAPAARSIPDRAGLHQTSRS